MFYFNLIDAIRHNSTPEGALVYSESVNKQVEATFHYKWNKVINVYNRRDSHAAGLRTCAAAGEHAVLIRLFYFLSLSVNM